MDINSSTKLYGIFGHPVRHSFSPPMHNAAFQKLGLNCVYLAFDIQPENLASAVESIRQLNIQGINVTIPHKQDIMNYLDEISDAAKYTGAVNTIKNEGGKLLGHNTDVGGFLKDLEAELRIAEFSSISACLIGAGGAARAVLSGLCMKGTKKIIIANRTKSKAERLAEYFQDQFSDTEISSVDLGDETKIKQTLAESNLLINSSSAGMTGHDQLNLPVDSLKENSSVYDLVYNPKETELVKQSKSLGHDACTGLGMLLYQGAESLELWTGKNAPIDVMKQALGL
ncbi:MAG: shikimate dehydrogenase [Candidatus Dadabacteria bacterium]|nr:shikimate dehydrogenase [Candidatus Dadabacteria bacterium]NIS09194.1 shikimate dehydrogenase [Candidatus Dadabacteria bacterium]NIV41810.1 shikimate dehydrogenase [Candidatus Dadabacteria bacterium]NIX15753.1 shikimate dehydrogenase [Candidatus Dadabacteria bacterium]NIY22625.1 shikimate dehydrogenase [Candidatus Dadabacteria bacterium]